MVKCENGFPTHPDYDPTKDSNCPACAKLAASRPSVPPINPTTEPVDGGKPSAPPPTFRPTKWLFGGKEPGSAASEMVNPVSGWLVVVSGPGTGRFYPIYVSRNRVGRDDDADVILAEDDTLQRAIHFEITYDHRLQNYSIESFRTKTLVYLEPKARFEFNPKTAEPLIDLDENNRTVSVVPGFALGERKLIPEKEVELSPEWCWYITLGRTTLRFVPFCELLNHWDLRK